MKTALVADTGGTGELFCRALNKSFHVIRCLSLESAQKNLCQKFDLILCEVSFDGYRAIPLLKSVKANLTNSTTPFVLVNAKENPSFLVRHDIELGQTLGARGFIEVHRWRTHLGDDAAAANLKIYIDSFTRFVPDQFWLVGKVENEYFHYRL